MVHLWACGGIGLVDDDADTDDDGLEEDACCEMALVSGSSGDAAVLPVVAAMEVEWEVVFAAAACLLNFLLAWLTCIVCHACFSETAEVVAEVFDDVEGRAVCVLQRQWDLLLLPLLLLLLLLRSCCSVALQLGLGSDCCAALLALQLGLGSDCLAAPPCVRLREIVEELVEEDDDVDVVVDELELLGRLSSLRPAFSSPVTPSSRLSSAPVMR